GAWGRGRGGRERRLRLRQEHEARQAPAKGGAPEPALAGVPAEAFAQRAGLARGVSVSLGRLRPTVETILARAPACRRAWPRSASRAAVAGRRGVPRRLSGVGVKWPKSGNKSHDRRPPKRCPDGLDDAVSPGRQ